MLLGLREIIIELQKEPVDKTGKKKRYGGSMVRYHGPYSDSSGKKFYLPRKWELNPGKDGRYKECDINYSFKKDEMKSGDLMRNLRWLGQSGGLMSMLEESEANSNDNSNNDKSNNELVGKGLVGIKMAS